MYERLKNEIHQSFGYFRKENFEKTFEKFTMKSNNACHVSILFE